MTINMADNVDRAPRYWRGYTLDELVYEKKIIRANIDLQRRSIALHAGRVRKGNVFLNAAIFMRFMRALNYADFFVLGLRTYRKLAPLFRK